ncbi:MAG: sulfite exporter TauE/SafE family protein [Deltaproteobacteria bacterium]|nr:sulfite exporter TauE/SafE family protein [Deltaproteobacteria bacterium]
MNLDLLGVFGAGVLTFATPCVLPLVPIYLAALVGGDLRTAGAEASRRGRVLLRAGLFSLGFLAVFTLLGLTATTVGGFLAEHRAALQLAGALLILTFGLKFLGVLSLPFLDRMLRLDERRVRTRFGGANAVLMGVVFAVGWSPCVGPVLGSVLTYAAAKAVDPWTGAGYLLVYGLGFALPLLVVAALAEAGTRLLRRVRPHLPRIEKALGALMAVVAVAMLVDLAPLLGTAGAPTRTAPLARDEAGRALPTMLALVSSDCSVCETMKPALRRITELCDGRRVGIRVLDVTADDQRHLARDFRLVGVPTFVFLDRQGEEVARLVGRQSERTLKQELSLLRGERCPGIGALPDRPAPPGVAPPPPAGARCGNGPAFFESAAPACDGGPTPAPASPPS